MDVCVTYQENIPVLDATLNSSATSETLVLRGRLGKEYRMDWKMPYTGPSLTAINLYEPE